ncbi:MAG TPA: DNA polymerase/3'-5' exonuclease PolX [Burkholderiales bacterium]|nr:DNA polymerase/3'-5' exonuclease PolX [Burkholderiales bacterium]
MPVHNADIAAVFAEIADLLEIEDANPFRVRAYRNAARILKDFPQDIAALLGRSGGKLPKLPGIGADLDAKIHEIVATGDCALLRRLRGEVPPSITELLAIPGLGPKRVRALYHDLGVRTRPQLLRAARDNRIAQLPGFGDRTQQNILTAVETRGGDAGRFKLAVAAQYAESLIAYLRRIRGVSRAVVAGSFRRMRETVGDLDILVVAADAAPVMRSFLEYEEVKTTLAGGATRASVVLRCGLQVDLRVVPAASYGAALVYFTGSKAHSIVLRRMAQERGLKLNEYGVFRGAKTIAGRTEQSVYAALGLPYIAPELRENEGEFEAARARRLPQLVERGDLRGDLHSHTTASDGRDSLRAMALAALAAGLEYLAITEHSRRLAMAHGLDPRRLTRQCDEIDRLNTELSGITLLKGIEVDILADGELDLPDSALAQLDVVIAAVHSSFDLPRERQTERIVRALANPYVTMLAHPTGRLIGERNAYDVDMLRIMREAKHRGCFLELDSQPDRLDLIDTHCRMAKEEGVPVAIDSDAHSAFDFANLRYGIGQARRGWLEADDVINTRSLARLRPLLRRQLHRSPRRASRAK